MICFLLRLVSLHSYPKKMLSEQDEANMRLATTHCSEGLVNRTIFKDEPATSTSFDWHRGAKQIQSWAQFRVDKQLGNTKFPPWTQLSSSITTIPFITRRKWYSSSQPHYRFHSICQLDPHFPILPWHGPWNQLHWALIMPHNVMSHACNQHY